MLLTPNISNLNLQLMFQKWLETELVAVEKRGELAGEWQVIWKEWEELYAKVYWEMDVWFMQ
jgi:hypothetical protein